jgi:hypothetical protein
MLVAVLVAVLVVRLVVLLSSALGYHMGPYVIPMHLHGTAPAVHQTACARGSFVGQQAAGAK